MLLDNRKVAGILVETVFIGNDIEYAIIGIGINANSKYSEYPEQLQPTLTTLHEKLNREVDLPRLFGYLVGQLEFWYLKLRDQGFKAIEPHYRRLCSTLGKQVTIDLGDQKLTGLAKRLEPDGSLVVQTPEGHNVIRSGDVVSSTSDANNE